jgi:hypothetical protein
LAKQVCRDDATAIPNLYQAASHIVRVLLNLAEKGGNGALEFSKQVDSWPVLYYFNSRTQTVLFGSRGKVKTGWPKKFQDAKSGSLARPTPGRKSSIATHELANRLASLAATVPLNAVTKDSSLLFNIVWLTVVEKEEARSGIKLEDRDEFRDSSASQKGRYSRKKKDERGEFYRRRGGHERTDAANVRAKIKANVKREFIKSLKIERRRIAKFPSAGW